MITGTNPIIFTKTRGKVKEPAMGLRGPVGRSAGIAVDFLICTLLYFPG